MPTKSQVQSWNTELLDAAAKDWGQRATKLKDAYDKAQHGLENADWSGTAGEQAKARMQADVAKVHSVLERIEHAQTTATKGAQTIGAAKRDAVKAIDDAEDEMFSVSEDLTVTDRLPKILVAPMLLVRELARHAYQAAIRGRSMKLATVDAEVAAALKLISTQLTGFKLGPGGGPGPDGSVPPGGVKNLGPIAGTGAQPGIPGIGAADLGEIVELPDGRLVAVFGDSFKGDKVGGPDNEHYRSVAVPIVGWDKDGRPIFGQPLNSPGGPGTPGVLFPPPPEALAIDPNTNPLPAGSFQANGKTYMMVSGTSGLKPTAGSWLVEVSNDPSKGWQPVPGSWRPSAPGLPGNPPTQVSGYQGQGRNGVHSGRLVRPQPGRHDVPSRSGARRGSQCMAAVDRQRLGKSGTGARGRQPTRRALRRTEFPRNRRTPGAFRFQQHPQRQSGSSPRRRLTDRHFQGWPADHCGPAELACSTGLRLPAVRRLHHARIIAQ